VIGCVAAVLVIEAIWFFERKAKIDDPVGAISVHGVGGLFGVLCVGIFSDGSYGAGWNLTTSAKTAETGVTGIIYDFGLGGSQLVAQVIAALVICTVMFGLVYGFFKIQNALTKGGIRSAEEDEVVGLDLPEMGVLAYPEFTGTQVDLESNGDKHAVPITVGAEAPGPRA
jgi:Amt family ammonium transporter